MDIIINQLNVIDYDMVKNADNVIGCMNKNLQSSGFLIFPELCLTGFPEKKNIATLYEEAKESFVRIIDKTTNKKFTIIVGHIEYDDGCYYNTCYFIKDAKIIHSHRKSKLWIDDVGVFAKGETHLTVDIDGIKCGAQVCFELEFPEGSRELAQAGVQVIFMPVANMDPFENIHYILAQARALENQCFVVTCNRVGVGHGGTFIGKSMLVSPDGTIVKLLSSQEETEKVVINLDEVEKSKTLFAYVDLI